MADAWGGSFGIAWGDSWGAGTPAAPTQAASGGGRSRWIRGAPYPWQKFDEDEEPEEPKVKKRVTVKLVDEALDEIAMHEGLPLWWHLGQKPAQVKKEIPEYVWVPKYEAKDHDALVEAVMTQIAEARAAEEEAEEEAIALLLS